MLISVLIAAYKAGPYISKALESLRTQTHTDWELIVVEDGSHDETEVLVSEFSRSSGRPVYYHNHGANKGVAEARNTLIKEARGEALAFLDADDLWDPTHLFNATNALAQGADLVVADVLAFDLDTGKSLQAYSIGRHLEHNPVTALFRQSHIVTCSAVTMRKNLAVKTGLFLQDLKVGEDRDFWIRCAKNGARFQAAPLTCHYAKHAASTMARTVLVSEQEVLFYGKYVNDTTIPGAERRHRLALALSNQARLIRRVPHNKALSLLLSAWRLHPLNLALPLQLGYTLALRFLPTRPSTT